MPIDAVTFDFWNTIVQEDQSGSRDRRATAWLGVLEGEGMAIERAEVDAALAAGWQVFEQHWRDNLPYGAIDAVEHALGVLGLTPPDEVRDSLVEALTDPPRDHRPALTDHIAECLHALRDAGVRLGIVCDVGLTPSRTLRRHLDDHGLLGLFDHWSFSDEVGVFKPDPRIFQHALAGLGVEDPARAAHVGDLRRTDVLGANRMGMTSVRYCGAFDDPGPGDGVDLVEADLVVADHADIAPLLVGRP